MEDRELLELAAKAAGIEVEWRTVSDMPGAEFQPCIVWLGISQGWWNPLRNDGAAFRLAFSLGIQIKWFGKIETVRRAIVRAAAEIGRNMP